MTQGADEGARPPRRRRRWAAAAALLVPLGLLVDAVWIEPYRLELTRHEVGAGPRAVRVLHLSDLHVDAYGPREREVVALARRLAPDLIVVTGDTATSPFTDPGARSAATEVLADLVALAPPLGALACPGNHEDWSGPPGERIYEEAGLPVLRSASRPLLEGALVVHGLGEPSERMPSATSGYDLLLCHYPAALPAAAHAGMELVLAGHTHGGQVRLPLLGPPWLPGGSGDYVAGWYEVGATRMYVSRGVGTSILPLRFLCRPEVALHVVRLPE